MKCKECIIKEVEWDKDNDPIICAFENWYFSSDNWNCWIMDILRDKVEWIYNDDTSAWLLPFKDWFIYLEWYKSRWTTDKLIVIAEDWFYKPYLEDLTELIYE